MHICSLYTQVADVKRRFLSAPATSERATVQRSPAQYKETDTHHNAIMYTSSVSWVAVNNVAAAAVAAAACEKPTCNLKLPPPTRRSVLDRYWIAGLTLLKSTESDRSSFGWTVRSLQNTYFDTKKIRNKSAHILLSYSWHLSTCAFLLDFNQSINQSISWPPPNPNPRSATAHAVLHELRESSCSMRCSLTLCRLLWIIV